MVGLEGIHIECKRTESFRMWDALEQSSNDARDGEKPVVIHRKNRKGWVVVQPLDDWLEMYEAWSAQQQSRSSLPEENVE